MKKFLVSMELIGFGDNADFIIMEIMDENGLEKLYEAQNLCKALNKDSFTFDESHFSSFDLDFVNILEIENEEIEVFKKFEMNKGSKISDAIENFLNSPT